MTSVYTSFTIFSRTYLVIFQLLHNAVLVLGHRMELEFGFDIRQPFAHDLDSLVELFGLSTNTPKNKKSILIRLTPCMELTVIQVKKIFRLEAHGRVVTPRTLYAPNAGTCSILTGAGPA